MKWTMRKHQLLMAPLTFVIKVIKTIENVSWFYAWYRNGGGKHLGINHAFIECWKMSWRNSDEYTY